MFPAPEDLRNGYARRIKVKAIRRFLKNGDSSGISWREASDWCGRSSKGISMDYNSAKAREHGSTRARQHFNRL